MSRPAPRLNPPDEVARLCAEYMWLARKLARPFQRYTPDAWREEYEGEAMVGLVEAARSWKPALSAFGTHAQRNIRSRLLMHWHKMRRRRPARAYGFPDGYEPSARQSPQHDPETFERLLLPLSPRDRVLLRQVFVDGASVAEAGQAIGIKQPGACKRYQAALERLRKHLRPQS